MPFDSAPITQTTLFRTGDLIRPAESGLGGQRSQGLRIARGLAPYDGRGP